MRALKFGLGLVAATTLVVGTPTLATADSTHICQGSRNCNDSDGGGGGKGHGHGKHNEQELECSNEAGDAQINGLANVCPQDFPILVDIL
jgi:hypothetical protein